MADHMQDEADLEALKRWWDENGKDICRGGCAVLGTVAGSSTGFTASQTEAASDLYAAMLANHLGDGDPDALASLATELRDDHASSTCAIWRDAGGAYRRRCR